jgi:hypothetical protein
MPTILEKLLGPLSVASDGVASVPILIKAAASQTGNLLEVNSNSGSAGDLAKISSAGALTLAAGLTATTGTFSGNVGVGGTPTRRFSVIDSSGNNAFMSFNNSGGEKAYIGLGSNVVGGISVNALALASNQISFGDLTGTGLWFMTPSGFFAATDNSIDIGASGANRPRNLYVAGTGVFGGAITGASYSGGAISGTTGTFSGRVESSSGFRATGYSPPSTGAGFTSGYSSGTGFAFAYDWDASAFKPINIDGLTLLFNGSTNGTTTFGGDVTAGSNAISGGAISGTTGTFSGKLAINGASQDGVSPFKIDGGAYIRFDNSASIMGYVGTHPTANTLIVGAASGDLSLVSLNKNILFSADGGATAHGKLTAAGAWTLSGSLAAASLSTGSGAISGGAISGTTGTFSSTLSAAGVTSTTHATINTATAGDSYLLLQTAASSYGLIGSRVAIDGTGAAELGIYSFGNNPVSLWTNNTRRFAIDGAGAAAFSGSLSAASLSTGSGAISGGAGTLTSLLVNGDQTIIGSGTTSATNALAVFNHSFSTPVVLFSNNGNVAIGSSSTGGSRLDVRGPRSIPIAPYQSIASFYSTDTLGADVGAGLLLGGVYAGSALTEFGQIVGAKENATSGNYAGNIVFHTRVNGGNLVEALRLKADQSAVFAGSLAAQAISGTTGTFTLSSASAVGLTIKAAASQTGNLQEWQDSSGTVLSSVDSSGRSLVKTSVAYGNLTVGGESVFLGADTTSSNWSVRAWDSVATQIFGVRNDRKVVIGGAGGITAYGVLTVADGSTVLLGVDQTSSNYALRCWDAAATSILEVRNDGRVGIGTASPGYKLDVSGTGNFTGALSAASLSTGSGSISGGAISGTTGTFTLSSASAVGLTVKAAASQTGNLQEWQDSSGTVLSSVDSSGRSLVKTGVAYGNLTVGGSSVFLGADTTSSNWSVRAWDSVATQIFGVRNDRKVVIGGAGGITAYGVLTVADGSTVLLGVDQTSSNYALRCWDNTATSILEVRNDGRVGIGTASPGYKLDVSGTGNFTGALSAASLTTGSGAISGGTGNFTGALSAASLTTGSGAISGGAISGTSGSFSNGVNSNSGGSVSTTSLNPGVWAYSVSGLNYGIDLGYNATSARYRTRLSAATVGDVALSIVPGGSTTQSAFTDVLVVRGDTGAVGVYTLNPSAVFEVNSVNPGNVAMALKAVASQTGNLLECNSNSGSGGDLAKITSAGGASFAGGTFVISSTGTVSTLQTAGTCTWFSLGRNTTADVVRFEGNTDLDIKVGFGGIGLWTAPSTYSGGARRLYINTTGNVLVNGFTASTVGLSVKAASSQTASLQDFQDSNANVLSLIDANGKRISYGTGVLVQGLNTPSSVTVTPQGTTGATTYGYRVAAINASGTTVASATTTTTTGNATLSVSNFNRIAWTAVSGATSYKVYGRTSGSELLIATVTAPTVQYDDTGAVTPSGALPSAPVGTTLAVRPWASQTGGTQEWQDVNGNMLSLIDLNGKRISYGTGGSILGLGTPTGLTITPQGTTGATTYGYRVAAVNANGTTTAASTATTATGNATLSVSNFNRVSWTAVNGATSYKVYGRTSGSELLIATVTAPTVQYDDTGAVTPSGALPGAPTGTKLVVQGWQNQTDNLQEWQNSSGTALALISTSGGATFSDAINVIRTDATQILVKRSSTHCSSIMTHSTSSNLYLMNNASFDGAAWNLANTAVPSWGIGIGEGDNLKIYRGPSGASTTTYTTLADMDAQGRFVLGSISSTGTSIATPAQQSKLHLHGTDASAGSTTPGPHIWVTTSADSTNPVFHQLNWQHNDISLNFDSYFDNANWKSSYSGSNFQIYKISNELTFTYASGIAAGSNISWTYALRLTVTGNAVFGSAAVATNATDGFLYITSCAGTPTGTPTAYTGRIPLVFDSTNHKLYAYDTAWRDLTGSGSGAPTTAQYVTLATDATLTSERVLTGTSGQITVTDNGAGSTVVLSAPGVNPVGAVVAWLKSFTNTPSLPTGWVECNGQTLSDAGSVYNGQVIPNLNNSGTGTGQTGNYFLRGNTATLASWAGGGANTQSGGSDTHSHNITVTGVTSSSSLCVDPAGTSYYVFPDSTGAGTSDNQSNVPKYIHVVWIMRVK